MHNQELQKQKLQDKVRQFDLCPLLEALEETGYTFDELILKGSSSCASSSSLCQKLEIQESGPVLTLNLGLLMGSSPLPNYFRKCMERETIDEEKFSAFIQFFNHHLLKDFLKMSTIEKFLLRNRKESNRSHLNLYGLHTISSLHWLFSLTFPELHLLVKKRRKKMVTPCPPVRFKASRLGDMSTLGGNLYREMIGYEIELKAESQQSDSGTFWPEEIRRRLKELIFPLLQKKSVYLKISLTIDTYNWAAFLSRKAHLGYMNLGERAASSSWLLYDGLA